MEIIDQLYVEELSGTPSLAHVKELDGRYQGIRILLGEDL